MAVDYEDGKEHWFVLGIVDGYGAIHSKKTKTCIGHATAYPGLHSFRWRWCEVHGLRESDHSKIADPVLRSDIEAHLKKKWGIA